VCQSDGLICVFGAQSKSKLVEKILAIVETCSKHWRAAFAQIELALQIALLRASFQT